MLDRLPRPDEAEIIRDTLAISKKREMSEAALDSLRTASRGHRFVKRQPVEPEPSQ